MSLAELEFFGTVRAELGQITIGTFSELFRSSLDHWSRDDYSRQWKEAYAQIRNGAKSSCFIVNVLPLPTRPNYESWIIWRHSDGFRIHNGYLEGFEDEIKVDPANPFNSIPAYRQTSCDGSLISEWKLPLIAFDEALSDDVIP